MTSGHKKALFLDRDGVINVERGYVHTREAFEFVPGIFELCRSAQDLGYRLVVITNQAGIARGYYSEADFTSLTDWMIERFAENTITISRVYYCPYHPVFGRGEYKRDSPDRKPNPGMLYRARQDLCLDLGSSILVGDKPSDIEAARAAGVGTQILLSPGSARCAPPADCFECYSLEEIRRRFFSAATLSLTTI